MASHTPSPTAPQELPARAHTDDLHLLLRVLPERLQHVLASMTLSDLIEIVMDLGRLPQARFPGRAVDLSQQAVLREELDGVVAAIGEFDADNRAGIQGTLHRISALRNRKGMIIGLTLRVGRAVFGTIELMRDLVERGDSVLLLGRPGIGKTTRLREIARVVADELGKRVIVIDTSNEIAGDGDIPHPAIGTARRMQVPHPEAQHSVMIEAVENHMPEVIIVDEIGTAAEAAAARTIAERGVQLIGTAHGNTLENVVMNPTLSDLVGGVQTVTLGDEEARFRGTQKTISERKASPTFDAVVEIVDRDEVIVHTDTADAVDRLLRDLEPGGMRRTAQGEFAVESAPAAVNSLETIGAYDESRAARIYAYAVSRDSVERAIRDLNLEARTVRRPESADMIIALRARADDPKLQRLGAQTGVPLHLVRKSTTAQIRRALQGAFNVVKGVDEEDVDAAVREAEAAVRRVLSEGVSIELTPRNASLRRMQHRIAARHHLVGESVGREPHRHLIIHPR